MTEVEFTTKLKKVCRLDDGTCIVCALDNNDSFELIKSNGLCASDDYYFGSITDAYKLYKCLESLFNDWEKIEK